jgi:hypothetical protein
VSVYQELEELRRKMKPMAEQLSRIRDCFRDMPPIGRDLSISVTYLEDALLRADAAQEKILYKIMHMPERGATEEEEEKEDGEGTTEAEKPQ